MTLQSVPLGLASLVQQIGLELLLLVRNLTQLSTLNLQNNSLTGSIPDLRFSRLKHLNLSYNNLSGSIPFSLQKFPNSSFLGTHSYVRRGRDASGASKGKAIIGGRTEKPKEEFSSGVQEAEKNKLVFFEGCSYNFDLEDLLRASAEVLGKGSYGTAYKAVLEDGTTVVVKRLKEVMVGKREFEQQMEIIGRLGQHPNVVPLRAYYYSKDEKLLVYDYIPAGNFSTLLHVQSIDPFATFDSTIKIYLPKNCNDSIMGSSYLVPYTSKKVTSIVKVALGAARGVAHLHLEGGGRFVHGNIKASNVLLTQDLDACVSDFGLAPLMNNHATPSRIIVGYRAPEAIETRKYTQKSDVYSFGVLLLELLTGKAPIQSPGRDDVVDLPRWVQSVVREEWTAEVFDVDLMRYQNIEEEMVQMLPDSNGMCCENSDQRPKIEDVVKMIEEIRQSDSEPRPSSEDKSKDSNVQTP
ncbi:hypothetical protein J5N97_013895 [Dioscorea zingiberensis]|uniref:Protein kinase domain-containing protein n=1 Tax=Dioscorea zingiberensis TaxID=325984 RepID=A0A9D5HJ69_9LILI|nr:hypothetical protein J5N97_013895 [Dioscorea zingiberensis]